MGLQIKRVTAIPKPHIKKLVDALAPHGVIAGGAARDVYFGTDEAEDIDVFCTDVYMVDNVEMKLRDMGFTINQATSNATTFVKRDHLPVQVIVPQVDYIGRKRFGNYMQVIEQFDFTCNQFALLPRLETAVIEVATTESAISAVRERQLVSVFDKDPVDHMKRLVKYKGKGYKVSSMQVLQQFRNWDQLDSDTQERIEDYHQEYALTYGSFS